MNEYNFTSRALVRNNRCCVCVCVSVRACSGASVLRRAFPFPYDERPSLVARSRHGVFVFGGFGVAFVPPNASPPLGIPRALNPAFVNTFSVNALARRTNHCSVIIAA